TARRRQGRRGRVRAVVASHLGPPLRQCETAVMTATSAAKRLGHPDTSTVFVGGLLGLFGILPASILTIFFGERVLAKYDAEPDRWGARGWVEAGITLAKIGLGIFLIELVAFVLLKLL